MNERIRELFVQAYDGEFPTDVCNIHPCELEKFAELIVGECIAACDEVAAEADAMKSSKYVSEFGRMLQEGMWGGAQQCKFVILNRLGNEE
jgi:hypothetical protein